MALEFLIKFSFGWLQNLTSGTFGWMLEHSLHCAVIVAYGGINDKEAIIEYILCHIQNYRSLHNFWASLEVLWALVPWLFIMFIIFIICSRWTLHPHCWASLLLTMENMCIATTITRWEGSVRKDGSGIPHQVFFWVTSELYLRYLWIDAWAGSRHMTHITTSFPVARNHGNLKKHCYLT